MSTTVIKNPYTVKKFCFHFDLGIVTLALVKRFVLLCVSSTMTSVFAVSKSLSIYLPTGNALNAIYNCHVYMHHL